MTSVDQAIAAANAQAQQVPVPNAGVPATMPAQPQPTAVAMPGAPVSMDSLMSGGISVDFWAKFSEHGINIGGNTKPLIEELLVSIDVSAVQPCVAVKYGNPAKYHKSYDQVVEDGTGKSWPSVVQYATDNGSTGQYRSADIPMELLEMPAETKKTTIDGLEVGKIIGYSLATTAWSNFEKFWRLLNAKGFLVKLPDGSYEPKSVRVKITSETKTNKNGNVWGVPIFTLIEDNA